MIENRATIYNVPPFILAIGYADLRVRPDSGRRIVGEDTAAAASETTQTRPGNI
jgi:hypothetical protein